MNPNPTKDDPAGRGDIPSGRQAAELPEHTGKENIAPETLHQGQGPDFQTQDRKLRKQNSGVNSSSTAETTDHQQEAAEHETKDSDLEKNS